LQFVTGMGHRLLLLVVSFTLGCGAQYRQETLGSMQARVEDGHAARTTVAVPVAASGHRHRIEYRIDLPRAVEVHYAIECPTVSDQGIVGETWEAYRERRLAELEQERAQNAKAAGAVTEALLGSVGARGSVTTPAGQGEVTAQVDGSAVGEAVAEQALPPVALSPADTGARQIKGTLEMPPPEEGQCALSLWSERPEQDLRDVTATITIKAIVDLDAEKRAHRARVRGNALEVRDALRVRLVAQGADPELRARLQAEVRLRIEADQRRRAGAEQRSLALALQARGQIREYLIALGADPGLRARLEAEARFRAEEKRRLRLEARARLEAEARFGTEEKRRLRLDAERLRLEARRRRLELALQVRGQVCTGLIAQGADPAHRDRQAELALRIRAERARAQEEARRRAHEELVRQGRVALEARADIVLWLQGNGAVVRPPRPPAPAEAPPPQTSATAVWVEGTFQWVAGQWVWSPGRWVEPPTARAVWLAPAEVLIDGVVVVRPGGWIDGKSGKRVNVRVRRP
jgi:hypothetical protein